MFANAALVLFAASTAFAAPANQPNNFDISVALSGPNVPTWLSGSYSLTKALEATSANPGPFTTVQLFFSDRIKAANPGVETRYRCALQDGDGNRIITTRGDSIDFTFGDNNNPKAWTLKDGPFTNVKVLCGPAFVKTAPADLEKINISLQDRSAEFENQVYFEPQEIEGVASGNVGGNFATVNLTLGPKIANQKLRCQLQGEGGKIVTISRGKNVGKESFSDAGKGEWTIDVGPDGKRPDVKKVTCNPEFTS